MDRPNYNPNLEPWYAPKRILQATQFFGHTYGEDFLKRGEFKRAREMFVAAIATIGAYVLDHENKYMIQLNNQSSTPDVMSSVLVETPGELVTLAHTPLEIVELEEHSPDTDLFEFIKRKKLYPAKKYENTMILCFVNKDIPYQDPRELVAKFNAENPSGSIFILGRASGKDINKYRIMTPYPVPSPFVDFDVVETVHSYHMPDSVTMVKGVVRKLTHERQRLEPFKIYETMGVNEAKVEKYKKI